MQQWQFYTLKKILSLPFATMQQLMQQFYILEIIPSLKFCNNATMQNFYILRRIFQVIRFATMQQFYFLKIIPKFTILQQCNNFTS